MNLNNQLDKYQTIALRFVALIIDYVLLIPLIFIGSEFINSYLVSKGVFFDLSNFTINTLLSSLFVFYFVLTHAFFGQTLGKMLVKVKVVDNAGIQINLGQSIIRSLPQIIPIIITVGFNSEQFISGKTNQKDIQIAMSVGSLLSLGLLIWTVLNIIVALSSDKHRAFHDYIAETVVIKTNV